MSLERLNVLRNAMVQADAARAKRFALYQAYKEKRTAELVAEWSEDVRSRAKAESGERSGIATGSEADIGLHEASGGSGAEGDGAGSGQGEQRRDDRGGRDHQPNVR